MRSKYLKLVTGFFIIFFVWCGAFAQAACVFEWAQDYAHSGDRSLRIYNDEAGGACSWVTEGEILVYSGREYDVSGWIKTENVADEAVIDVAFYDSGGSFIARESTDGVSGTTSNAGESDFVRRAKRVLAPLGSVNARIGLALVGSGTAWFDDVYFSEVVSDENVVSVVPSMQVVGERDPVFVDINIANTQNLYGFQFELTYNAAVLEYINLVRGSFLGSSDDIYWVGLDTSTPGEINNIAATRTTPGVTVSGSGTLVSLEFRAIAGGASEVEIGNLKLSDPNAVEIFASSRDGEVIVGGGGVTETITPTVAPTPTPTPTPTPIPTSTPIPTVVPTLVPSPTSTPIPTAVPTFTPTPPLATPTLGPTPTPVPTPLPDSCQYGWVADYAHSGDRSLMIHSDDPESICSWVNNEIADVQEGQVYEFSSWIRTDNVIGGTYVEMVFYNGSGEEVSRKSTSVLSGTTSDPSENDFVQRTESVIVPTGAVDAELRLVLSGTGTAWFDDLSLVQITPDVNTVRVSPQSQTVNEEENVVVSIDIVETENLYGFQFDIAYDPTILEYTGLERGTFIGFADDIFWVSEDSSIPGIIRNIAATRTTPGITVEGSGTLVNLNFSALAEGTSEIRIRNLKLSDSDAQEILSTAGDGEVVVLSGEQIGPYVDIKAEGLDGPVTIPSGNSATLSWTSQRATSCQASGDWLGIKSLSGLEETDSLTSDKSYILTCTGSGGETSDEVAVLVEEEIELYGDLKVAIDSSNWTDDLQATAPLYGVDLKGVIAQCTINYTFWCNCSNSGIYVDEVVRECGAWDYKKDGTHDNPLIVDNLCNYPASGTYSPKVIIEKYDEDPTEDRATILVIDEGTPMPTPTPSSGTEFWGNALGEGGIELGWTVAPGSQGYNLAWARESITEQPTGYGEYEGKAYLGNRNLRSYQINGLTAEKWCFGLCSSNGGGWISCEGSEQYFTCADVVAGALPT
ncbi:cohesin domain-containing protein, partial [Patescibacteria group bacterium]|nr:cohesin domain-containing protein [Patescibacteria group bacterium]